MKDLSWFKTRRYRHFDRPVCEKFAKRVMCSHFVAHHSFSPLIKYEKTAKKFKKFSNGKYRKITKKSRPIMYASHRDSCILAYYSSILNRYLEEYYSRNRLEDCVIAYRKTGNHITEYVRGVRDFSVENSPVVILAFDVERFFDTLDHQILKANLKSVLKVPQLETDWYNVFRYVTRYCYIDLEDLKKHEIIGDRIQSNRRSPFAKVAELKKFGIVFRRNEAQSKGIPQGTTISATLSNLYMIEFDSYMKKLCDEKDALYRRYSDDILIVCKPEHQQQIESLVNSQIENYKLKLNLDKSEQREFDVRSSSTSKLPPAQYLGFNIDENGISIRQSTISRQHRRLQYAIKKAKKDAKMANSMSDDGKVWTKRLWQRFTKSKGSNFSSYARRCALEIGESDKITRQIKRFERVAATNILDLNQRNHK